MRSTHNENPRESSERTQQGHSEEAKVSESSERTWEGEQAREGGGGEKSLPKFKVCRGSAVGRDELKSPKTQNCLLINPPWRLGFASEMGDLGKSLRSHECGTGICGSSVLTA